MASINNQSLFKAFNYRLQRVRPGQVALVGIELPEWLRMAPNGSEWPRMALKVQ